MANSNSTNKFGPSSYVVGPELGNGVNFTSINAAQTQALADGFGVFANPAIILIRAGVYTENVVLNSFIGLQGVFDGTIPLVGTPATIVGDVTVAVGAASFFAMSNLTVTNSAGSALVISGAGVVRFIAENCSFITTFAGANGVDISCVSGTFSLFDFRNCSITGSDTGILVSQHNIVAVEDSRVTSTSSGLTAADTSRYLVTSSSITAGSTGIVLNGSNRLDITFSNIQSTDEAIFGSGAGDSVSVYQSIIDSSAASGFWIDNVSSFESGDVSVKGTALGTNVIANTQFDWQPYAGTAAAASPIVFRGTSCYDSSQFTVTNGFVHAIFAGAFPWVEQSSSVTVNPNEGNFTVANITLTLPPAPTIGMTCKFKVVTNDTLIIVGQPGDFLQIGSQGGTTLTNSSSGDALELTHYDLGIWIANSVIGNWAVT